MREYDLQVPFGVVRERDRRIAGIEEKPIQRFFVNAGIYVLAPEALEPVPPDTRFDMPTLFEALVEQRACARGATTSDELLAGHRPDGRLRPRERRLHADLFR